MYCLTDYDKITILLETSILSYLFLYALCIVQNDYGTSVNCKQYQIIIIVAWLSSLVSLQDTMMSFMLVVLDMRTQNGDEPVGEITFLGAKLPF